MAEPKIRFPKFSKEWSKLPLNHFLFENTERNKEEKYSKEDVLSVSGEYGIVNQIEFQGRSFAGESVAPYHVVNTGDIVYTKSPLKANPYGIIKYNAGKPGIVSTLYAVYHCRENTDGKFVELYFSNDYRLNKYLKPLVNIGAKHDMKVNNDHAISGSVVFPSIEEQKAVVSVIDSVDEVISTLIEEIHLWEEKKKGVMQKIFSQEVRFKDDNGEDYPEWDNKPLRELMTCYSGGTPKSGTPEFYGGKIPFIRSGEIHQDYTELFLTEEGLASSSAKMVDAGDIIYAMYGATSGDVAISKIKGAINQAILCIKPISMDSRYLCHYLVYAKDSITRRLLQGGQGNLSADLIKSVVVPVPEGREQQKISDCLSSIDEVIAIKKQKLETWKNIKKGLLQQMFV